MQNNSHWIKKQATNTILLTFPSKAKRGKKIKNNLPPAWRNACEVGQIMSFNHRSPAQKILGGKEVLPKS